MKNWEHTFDGKQVFIDWNIVDTIDYHDNEYNNVALEGEDENGIKYTATGDTLSGELCDVYDIELA
jgi:hypothetical protein